jgi:hypothetical protein
MSILSQKRYGEKKLTSSRRPPTSVLLVLRCAPALEDAEASAIWANEWGDLCFTLVCGHGVQYIFRGEWGYTQALIERGLATGELRLGRRQRC